MRLLYQHVTTMVRLFFVSALLVLTGCSTTGSSFDATSMDMLSPGQTTLTQASVLLKADPINVYRPADGSAMARWAHGASFVPDAVYFNRELWLAFDRNGYFDRVVKSVNVPQASRTNQMNQVTGL